MSDINPYSAPQADEPAKPPSAESRGVWQDIEMLVLRKDATLPGRCVLCAAPADGRRIKVRLRYHHPGLSVLTIYWLIAQIVAPKAVVHIPLCERHEKQRRQSRIAFVLLALAGLALSWFALATEQHPALFMIGCLMVGLSVAYLIATRCPIQLERIDDRYVWFKKVHPDFLSPLPWFPQYGETMDLD